MKIKLENHNLPVFNGFESWPVIERKSYLTNRYQRTLLYNENNNIKTSTWAEIEHGVPKGLVFGPLLFLVLVNDFPKFLIMMYIDSETQHK
jgi:hypothetical protein